LNSTSSTDPPEVTLRPIGYVLTGLEGGDSTPAQATDNVSEGELVVHAELREGLKGLEGFDYVWLITWFDRVADEPAPLEQVPRPLRGTGRRFGVFATRSPARPNPVGLSLVRVLGIEGRRLRFAGVDLLDRTPVLDIKPFFPEDDVPVHGADARTGF
jgi:tRNA-Thr(GGU) m(6)t(6)A37 methyltransferase TsaA